MWIRPSCIVSSYIQALQHWCQNLSCYQTYAGKNRGVSDRLIAPTLPALLGTLPSAEDSCEPALRTPAPAPVEEADERGMAAPPGEEEGKLSGLDEAAIKCQSIRSCRYT